MKTKTTSVAVNKPSKRTYQKPKLKSLGSVRKITLKTGSDTDGFGGHF